MTYIQASRILLDESKFTERQQILAAKKVYKLSMKALKAAVITEHILNTIGFFTRWVMWFGGVFLSMYSFLRLAYNTTADYITPASTTVMLELMLLIGIASAYVGNRWIEKERRGKHGKDKQ